MAISYSDEQLEVINTRNKNILVSAAAGAGKTSVLVERIIDRTIGEDPVDIDRILVVTFTNAAAAEMKDRLISVIDEKMEQAEASGDRGLFKALERQATLVHNAQISTIDGFCLNIVRNHFHKIDLDPSFRIATEGEVDLLRNDILKKVMESAYEEADPEFFNLVDAYSVKSEDTAIEDGIEHVYKLAMSHPAPEKWLESCKELYSYKTYEEFRKADFISDIRHLVCDRLKLSEEALDKLLKFVRETSDVSGTENVIDQWYQKAVNMGAFMKDDDFEGASKVYEEPIEGKLSFARGCDAELKERVKSIRDSCKKDIDSLYSSYLARPLKDAYEDHMISGRLVCKLIDLVLEFKKNFDAAKRERGIIDFSDMGHMAIQILIKDYKGPNDYEISDVAKEYRDYFEEIMTDEYQDSNEVQEIILSSISRAGTDRPGNRFMVGDVKQSIYKFRLAKPEIFMKHYRDYSADGEASKVIGLSANYRSRSEVVDAVNDVFSAVMHESLGGVEYDEKEYLRAKASYPEGGDPDNKAEIILLEGDGLNADKARELEANAIASKIKELCGKKTVYDRKKNIYRPAEYGDITVLYRSIKSHRAPLRKALEASGIPYHMEGVGTFYETTEIKDIINLLTILDNPLNDIALYGTMTSYFGGMDDEYCARIKAEGDIEERTLWDRLKGFLKRNPGEVKAENFVKMVEEYRFLVTYTPISELLTKLVTKTGYLNYVSALPDGKQREANIELLIKKASDYAKTSFSGLFHFMRYVELIKKNEDGEGEANIFDENANTVRIMTIHKSKGLEFPICIVAGIDTGFDTRDASATFVANTDIGIAASSIDPEKRTKRSTLLKKYIGDRYLSDSAGEEIRILYVAMTRAKEQLILMGVKKNAERYFESSEVVRPDSYLSLLKMAVSENGSVHFKFTYPDADSILVSEVREEIDRRSARSFIESDERLPKAKELSDLIIKTIGFEYPHKNLERLFTKTTVSELKMEAMEEVQGETRKLFEKREQSEFVPEFAGGGKKVSGTDRGTAYHDLLKLIDFKEPLTPEEWKRQFKHMVDTDQIEQYELDLVDEDKIFSFAKTDLARRMHEAALRNELHKEQPFVMGVPANRVDEDFPEDETILVQGVIDVYFVEDGRVVVMDYKTDRVKDQKELTDRYKKQIVIYAEALEKLTAMPVSEMLLYSFGLNDTIVVE